MIYCFCSFKLDVCGGLPTGFAANTKVNTAVTRQRSGLLGALVLGDCLGSFGDSMLGEFTREDKAYSGLYLSGGHGGLLVVLAKASCLTGDTSEGVRDEGVEDGHGALGDSGVRVYLLEDAVDVDVIGLSWFATASFSFWSSSSSSTYFSGHLVLISFLKVFFLNG